MEDNKYVKIFKEELSLNENMETTCVEGIIDIEDIMDALAAVDVELLDVHFQPAGVADIEKYLVMDFCEWFKKTYENIIPTLQEIYDASDAFYGRPMVFLLNNDFVVEAKMVECCENVHCC